MSLKRIILMQLIFMLMIVLPQEKSIAGLADTQQRLLMLAQYKEGKLEEQMKIQASLAEIERRLSDPRLTASQQRQLIYYKSQFKEELKVITNDLTAVEKEFSAFDPGGSQQRAAIKKEVKFGAGLPDSSYGRFYALVIGNQNYKYLTKLKTPLADAKAVAEVLELQYGFTVELLLDKTTEDIRRALSKLRRTMTSKEDNLLIYYAGHGYLDELTSTGYWQPIDAETDNTVFWIPTDEITHLLKAIPAKHVLVVVDSCYSGSLLMRDSGARLPRSMGQNEWLRRMQARRSRTALTSGGEEPVADGGGSGHSVFAKTFLEVLRENKNILDSDTLFDLIKNSVVANARQTPRRGVIQMTGDDQGDFLLVPKELQETKIQKQAAGETDLDFLKRGVEQESTKTFRYE